MQIVAKTRKWGNSIGVVLPKREVERLNIQEDERVVLEIKKQNPLRELFGAGKDDPITREEFREFRRGLESKWL